MADRVDEDELKGIVSQQIQLARLHDKEDRETDRTKAIEYFFGEMNDIPAPSGRSSVVSRDVADTIGWMLPGIMRVFTASDQMAVAEPVRQSDDEWSGQATDGINHVFWKENNGYEVVYNATWDALLTANGIVKVFYDDTPEFETSFHSGLLDEELVMLLQPNEGGEEPEVLEHTASETIIEIEGQAVPVQVNEVKIKRQISEGKQVIESVAPEDFLIDADALDIEDAAFVAHRREVTRSELVEMGFDLDKVKSIPRTSIASEPEETARSIQFNQESVDTSMEKIDLYECYMRIDLKGKGIAEVVRVMYAGDDSGQMLDWEIWEDSVPFADIPCNPVPHRWRAQSIADETIDVQQIKTSMLRQANDNIYASNNPQRFASGKIKNPEELINPSFGSTVFGEAGANVVPLEVPFVAGHAYDAINYQDQVVQRRTGVGRQTMALDPEALQNQSATANQNEKDAAYSQIELVARNMAEWGWKKVFKLLLKSMVKHQNKAKTIRLRDEWVEIDPRHWNADMDITINVGLGTGSRDRDAGMLNTVLAHQTALAERFAAAGFEDKAIDMLPFIHNTLTKFAESTGLRNPEAYYPEFSEKDLEEGKQRIAERKAQPDPEMQLKQAELQSKVQLEREKAQAQVNREQAQMEADLIVKEKEDESAMVLEGQKNQLEREKMDINALLKNKEIETRREIELIKLGVKETEDGRRLPAIEAMEESNGKSLGEIRDLLNSFASNTNAPKRVVRDATGPIGIEKFINGEWVMTEEINRGDDGRVAGLTPLN